MELASEMAETIVQKVDSSMSLVEELSTGKSLRKHVASLKDPMRSLRAKLKESQMWMTMREENAVVKTWLKNVRSALYEIEDLAEQISAQAAATDGGNNSISMFRLKLNLRWSCGKMSELTEILKVLVEETPEALSPDVQVGRRPNEKTQSALSAVPLVGRGSDRNKIVGMLQQEPDFSVVVVSGMAGLGKTTLAQLVFNYSRLPGFNTRLWVWVGSELEASSIISRVGEEMAAREAKARETVSCADPIATPDENKLLLVLDDVRILDEETLIAVKDSVMSMLVPTASATVKIVITTRDDKVATVNYGIIPINRHSLGPISDEEAQTLFKKVAFTSDDNDNDDGDEKLWDLGREILKRTKNVPRTIKDMALLLHKEKNRKWKALMNAEFGCLKQGYSPVPSASTVALRLLPSPLKRCFMYSAFLQRNNRIEMPHLIHLWMAQGYITKKVLDDENQTLEEVAEEYYTALRDWSFLEDHDADFQLANHVAETEMSRLQITVAQDGSVLNIETYDCNGIYHLFLNSTANQSSTGSIPSQANSTSLLDDLITSLPSLLRSFLKARGSPLTLTTSICDRLFTRLGQLRSLDLNSSGITKVPNSIGSLKHLRYLNLSLNGFKTLPESITTLAKLQVLDLSNCKHLANFPNHFCRLRKLRHLYINGCQCLTGMPVGLGKMTSLQTLNVFVLGTDQKSCKLAELSSLNLKSELTYEFASQL